MAQQKPDSVRHYNNAVYLELGGPALVYSVGYERIWYRNNWFSAISSAGFSFIPDGIQIGYVEPGVLFRDKNLAFEIGVALVSYKENPHNGSQFSTPDGSAKVLYLNARVGARFFSKNQHFHYRIGLTPFMELSNNEPLSRDNRPHLWLNVFTVGYRF
ncbi:MAG: hypothetical protein V4561_08905 [Bacteroidota bacterium]